MFKSNQDDSPVWPVVLVIYQAGFHDEILPLFQAILQDIRVKTVSATNKAEVLKILKTQSIDLFMVAGCGNGSLNHRTGHVHQPHNGTAQFDGLGLGKLVRQKHPQLQGIFTSGYFLSEHILADIDRCGMAFLPKPFRLEEMLELVLMLLWNNGESACCPSHFFSCGRIKQAIGDSPRALQEFNKTIELNPGDAQAYNHRSEIKFELGDFSGAALDSLAAVGLNPQYMEAYLNHGRAQWESGNLDKARAAFDKSIELDGNNLVAYHYRSHVKFKQHDSLGALEDLNQMEACKGFRPSSKFYEDRGDVRESLGDLDGAVADYDQAIALHEFSSSD